MRNKISGISYSKCDTISILKLFVNGLKKEMPLISNVGYILVKGKK
jgi:hypothetical protein